MTRPAAFLAAALLAGCTSTAYRETPSEVRITAGLFRRGAA